ncbi:MAG: M10 family metallopeptidase C-terminal domain-containing protein [Alphaproteobacteria bacterium]|nr:M10 family metallopeptidase C-terminal domain-containing protein [Alphaproteobacteria bacterium]
MPSAYLTGLVSGNEVSSRTISFAFSDRYFNWTSYEEAQFREGLETWSNVARIRFVETANEAAADFLFFTASNSVNGGALGSFEYPWGGQQHGYFNAQGTGWDRDGSSGGLEQGGYGFVTIIHEIGHGLGLAHPHDADGASTIFPGVSHAFDTGTYGLNQGLYTVMSYNDGRVADRLDPDVTGDHGWTGTPMAFDIYAIQQIYGANTSYRTGNDTYWLPDTNEEGTFYQAIWDAGGRDTIAYAGSDTTRIDLREASLREGDPNAGGHLSKADGIYGGFTIAKGVTIEVASGGSGRDVIVGNSANNTLLGNDGNDSLLGGGGVDILRGGEGVDVLRGGDGGDRIEGGTGNDRLYGEEGNDRLFGQDGNNIALGGNGNDYIYGGTDNDRLYGQGGNDRLTGSSGVDVLSGSSGNDVLLGNNGNDYAVGGSGNDLVMGGNDQDRVYGQGGNDALHGQAGNDLMIGGAGDDRMFGGAGDDRLYAGAGKDLLSGGGGDDRYVFGAGDDRALLTNNWGDDTIIGFRPGHDTLDFSRVSGLRAFSQLDIDQDGRDTVISYGGDSVRLVNVTPGRIDDDDFIL